jgi:uncharacterized coiled-coil protein SlyX
MELPLYRIVINDNDDTGCTTVSLVENPAVEIPFLCFEDEHKKELFHADEDKHIISGIAMLADTPIYRNSPSRGEYQIVFEKETIRKMVQKYAKNQLFNLVNLQHDSDTYVNSCYLIESLIIDKERGICPNEFQNVPDGSWYISYYVDDDALWNEIKNGKHLNGFSIEILSEIELMESNKQENTMNKFFKLAKMILKLEEVKTDKETLIIEGGVEVGKPVFVETEEGPIPAADGDYTLEDGTVVVIVEGVITEIIPVETPEEKPEELEEENPLPEEDPKVAELEARIAELEAIIAEKDTRIAELEGLVAEKEEALSAAEDKLKMSVETPVTKKVINKENKALKYFS